MRSLACVSWAAPAQAATINFETDANGSPISAPAVFSSPFLPGTLALTDAFEPLGVVWEGNGAILSTPGNFGATGFSGPNYLAYNSATIFEDGKSVGATDTMSFSSGKSEVSFNIGLGEGPQFNGLEEFFAKAFDAAGNLLASFFFTPTTSDVVQVLLTGEDIRSVEYGLSRSRRGVHTGRPVIQRRAGRGANPASGRATFAAFGSCRAGPCGLAAQADRRCILSKRVCHAGSKPA